MHKLVYLIVLIIFIIFLAIQAKDLLPPMGNALFYSYNVTFFHLMCYHARRAVDDTAEFHLTHECLKEKTNE